MKCEEIKQLYDGYKSEIIEGELFSTITSHLSDCKECNNFYMQNERLTTLLERWEEIEPQPNYVSAFWTKVDEAELNSNKGIVGFFKGLKTAFVVPSLAVALFCSLIIVNMYRSSTPTPPPPQAMQEDFKDDRLLLEINDIISHESGETLKVYGLWNDLEEESKEG